MLDTTPLTIMGYRVGGSARRKNGEKAGIIEASGVRGTELDLEAETGSISTPLAGNQTSDLPWYC